MIVEVSAKADDELASALAFLRVENPSAAERVYAAILRTLDTLMDFPNRGRHGRIDGTRELVVRGAPYVVVYVIDGDRVLISSIRHTSRGLQT